MHQQQGQGASWIAQHTPGVSDSLLHNCAGSLQRCCCRHLGVFLEVGCNKDFLYKLPSTLLVWIPGACASRLEGVCWQGATASCVLCVPHVSLMALRLCVFCMAPAGVIHALYIILKY